MITQLTNLSLFYSLPSHIQVSPGHSPHSWVKQITLISITTPAAPVMLHGLAELLELLTLWKTLRGIFQDIIHAFMWIRGKWLQRLNQESPTEIQYKRTGKKKETINLHYTTRDKQLLHLYYPHLIPSRRKVLDLFLVTQESEDPDRGLGVLLTALDILGYVCQKTKNTCRCLPSGTS